MSVTPVLGRSEMSDLHEHLHSHIQTFMHKERHTFAYMHTQFLKNELLEVVPVCNSKTWKAEAGYIHPRVHSETMS